MELVDNWIKLHFVLVLIKKMIDDEVKKLEETFDSHEKVNMPFTPFGFCSTHNQFKLLTEDWKQPSGQL